MWGVVPKVSFRRRVTTEESIKWERWISHICSKWRENGFLVFVPHSGISLKWLLLSIIKIMRKFILWIVSLFAVFGLTFAQVSLNPVYTSERFQPSDKFHAGCENQINVVFSLDNSKINWLNAILHYDWNNVDVLKIVVDWEKENNLSYTVENDKIIFSKLKSEWDWMNSITFSVFFRVWATLESSDFSFEKWSYVVDSKWNMVDFEWNYNFQFWEVPECDPDIVAPSVELLFPKVESWDYVALDTYFQFEVDDAWKWVNPDSIIFKIDGWTYSMQMLEHEWNDKILTIYPDFWMPFNTWFEVEITVSDKQSYWKANTTTALYEFQTSDGLNLLNEIDPVEFRKLVNMDQYFKWTTEECKLLSELYSDSDQWRWELLKSINSRLDCWEMVVVEKTWSVNIIENIDEEDWKDFSVFAMLWWILFGSSALFMIFSWLRK